MAKKSNGDGSVRQLPDGSWECIIQSKYLNPATCKPKRIKRKGKNEKDAIKKCKQAVLMWERQYEAGTNSTFDRNKPYSYYMSEYIDNELKQTITASSYRTYVHTLNQNFYNYPISKLQLHMLNYQVFDMFFTQLYNDKSNNTAKTIINLCKRCGDYMVRKGYLTENHARLIPAKKIVKDDFIEKPDDEIQKTIFSHEDIHKFYEAYKNNLNEYSPIIVLMLETMMRGQEALALRINDVDFDKNIITIRRALSKRFQDNQKNSKVEHYLKVPKNGEERIVYMTPLAREVVEYLIAKIKYKVCPNPDNLLFPSYSKKGKMRSMETFEMQFKELCDKIGVDRDVRRKEYSNGIVRHIGLSVHDLRHTAITLANTAPNANVVNTALMAGHRAISTENVYTHSNVEALKGIQTASSLVLNQNKSRDNSEDHKNTELYEMYLKLKEKFEQ